MLSASQRAATAMAVVLAAAASSTLAQPPADVLSELRQRPPQDEVIYFLLPDRFENGDPANDRGGLTGGPPLSRHRIVMPDSSQSTVMSRRPDRSHKEPYFTELVIISWITSATTV